VDPADVVPVMAAAACLGWPLLSDCAALTEFEFELEASRLLEWRRVLRVAVAVPVTVGMSESVCAVLTAVLDGLSESHRRAWSPSPCPSPNPGLGTAAGTPVAHLIC